MSYTDRDYLNRMISVALNEQIVTEDEILLVIDRHGSTHESVAIDIISMVYQRCEDCGELREMQRIFRHCHKSGD